MLQLDPSRSNHSTISVLSLPERLTVEWSNVSVMADAEHPAGGAFTFQVTAAQPQRQLHYIQTVNGSRNHVLDFPK